ncbi:XRE family transcriptional regulator [Parabacteroides sp. AF18-52]|jgi:toxin-antitoxin system, antitoxin component, xre family|uniref:helix-turn-helix domain-containing protein n=1 Tax=Parabacteroides TaxID=375288 RepID=UPI000EFF9960|nr:helix-turn-helix transcriptional regulator [Parabacteroides sp. AF18-52]RHR39070.1 XRE family transcriptional regulator [Parabacteroides sp. AF18-52]
MERETEEKTRKNVHQGANVRRLRNIMGVKQSSLAEKLGTTQQKVSRIESQRVIEKDTLLQIANILHVSPKIIEELDENPLSIVIENNNFETGYGSIGNLGIIQNDQNNENTINNPLDKIMELNKQATDLFERMLAVEKEKSALLEQLLKEKGK